MPKDVDAYLSKVPEDARAALSTLRKRIKAAAPRAIEELGYGVVMFKVDGHPLVGMGAAKNHCALYGSVGFEELGDAKLIAEIEKYDTSKGTIRFTPDKPIPAALVKRIVRLRLAQIEARWGSARR